MIDAFINEKIEKPRQYLIKLMGLTAINPHFITLFGVILAVIGGIFIFYHQYLWALFFMSANRICDGIDGAIARLNPDNNHQIGAFFDLCADYVYYITLPVAFGLGDAENSLYSMLLLGSFVLSAVSFLGYADYARRAQKPQIGIKKGIYYGFGIIEGFETNLFFALFLLFPSFFPLLSIILALLCVATFLGRIFYLVQKP